MRNFLHISDDSLCSVLNSTANPILEIFDLAIDETVVLNTVCNNKTEKLALLQLCNYDLRAVEMRIRENSPKTASLWRKMEPNKALSREIHGGCDTVKACDLLERECINPHDVLK